MRVKILRALVDPNSCSGRNLGAPAKPQTSRVYGPAWEAAMSTIGASLAIKPNKPFGGKGSGTAVA